MINMGDGDYIYTFEGYDNRKEYIYHCNPNSTLAYIESGVTDRRLDYIDKSISDIVSGGGGGFSTQGIQTSIGNMGRSISKKMEEEHAKTRELIKIENNETNSHIDVAKDTMIDTINSIEMPELVSEEKEAKRALKIVTEIDKKLSTYIEVDMKEKDEIGSVVNEITRMKMEDIKAEKEEKRRAEEEKKKEEENDQKELEMIQSEFEQQEAQEEAEKREKLEQELQEKEKEVAEIKKELNTL